MNSSTFHVDCVVVVYVHPICFPTHPCCCFAIRNLECDVALLMERYLGRRFPSFGKDAVMGASSKTVPPKFSRYSRERMLVRSSAKAYTYILCFATELLCRYHNEHSLGASLHMWLLVNDIRISWCP